MIIDKTLFFRLFWAFWWSIKLFLWMETSMYYVRICIFKILGKNGDIACFYSVENLWPCHKLEVVKTFKDCHLEIKNWILPPQYHVFKLNGDGTGSQGKKFVLLVWNFSDT